MYQKIILKEETSCDTCPNLLKLEIVQGAMDERLKRMLSDDMSEPARRAVQAREEWMKVVALCSRAFRPAISQITDGKIAHYTRPMMCRLTEKWRMDALHCALTEGELKIVAADIRDRGLTIAATNGCFDILHPGHLHMFNSCAIRGDVVIVAINSDHSFRECKGFEPAMNQNARALMVLVQKPVDYVYIFKGSHPGRFLELARPDFWLKDERYEKQKGKLPEQDYVEKCAGELVIVPTASFEERVYSTTHIRERIIDIHRGA